MSYIPNNITDCIIEAAMALEKSKFILGDLTDKYPFDADPNEKMQGWRFEYGRITAYMDMAFDYVHEAIQKLERAREIENKTMVEKVATTKAGDVA